MNNPMMTGKASTNNNNGSIMRIKIKKMRSMEINRIKNRDLIIFFIFMHLYNKYIMERKQ